MRGTRRCWGEFAAEPGASGAEVMANDVNGTREDEGDLVSGETTEVIEFDHPGEIRICGGELVEGEVEIEHAGRVGGGGGWGLDLRVQGERAAATSFDRRARTGIVHQHLAHYARHQGEKMDPIGEFRRCRAENFQIGLIDERGGLQGVPFRLSAQERAGEAAELVIQVSGQIARPVRTALAQLIEDVAALTLHADDEYSEEVGCHEPRQGLADAGKYGMIDTRQRPEGRVGKQ